MIYAKGEKDMMMRYTIKNPDVNGPEYDWCISDREATKTLKEMAADILSHSANYLETERSKGFQAIIFAITALENYFNIENSETLNEYYRLYFNANLEEIKGMMKRER